MTKKMIYEKYFPLHKMTLEVYELNDKIVTYMLFHHLLTNTTGGVSLDLLIKLLDQLDVLFLKLTSKGLTETEMQSKLEARKISRRENFARKKAEYEIKKQERERIAQEKKEQEKREVLAILDDFVAIDQLNYTNYEYNEVRRNRKFFRSVEQRVFEPGEQGLSFIYCEFDKSSKREFYGYLFVTNKRVFFIDKRLGNFHKFNYRTIMNVTWFHDGLLEKGLHIQYGQRRLEFDEMFDKEQMMRVANLILRMSSR